MQVYAQDGRPLPLITPVSEPFFAAAREGRLHLQHCPRDGFFFYPRSHCPHCLGDDWSWREASPRGKVYAFTIDRSGQDPHQRGFAPITIAVVDLDDGPRMIGNLVACDEAQLRVGLPVVVAFEQVDGTPLVRFRPCADP